MAVRHKYHGSFDSDLDLEWVDALTNCSLRIHLKLKLDFVDPATSPTVQDFNHNTFHPAAWTAAERHEYSRRVVMFGSRFWDDHFWLQTPDLQLNGIRGMDFSMFDGPPGHPAVRRNVRCRMRLEVVPSGQHFTVRIVRLADSDHRFFRASSILWCNRSFRALRNRYDHARVTVYHEIGHLLGLSHTGVSTEDPDCMAANDPNADGCYEPLHPIQEWNWGDDVMAGGMMLSRRDALPWQRAIASHTQSTPEEWHAFLNPSSPQSRPHKFPA